MIHYRCRAPSNRVTSSPHAGWCLRLKCFRPPNALTPSVDTTLAGELYQFSALVYRGLPELDYPLHEPIRHTRCGRICRAKHKVNLSQAFAGQNGINESQTNSGSSAFMHYDLGYLGDQTCRLEAFAYPFGPKVLPMSSE